MDIKLIAFDLDGTLTQHKTPLDPVNKAVLDRLREKYTLLKNSSLEGARILLLDHDRLAEAKELAENIYCVQFASIPDFLLRMQAAKFIPHTDMSKFPSIAAATNR